MLINYPSAHIYFCYTDVGAERKSLNDKGCNKSDTVKSRIHANGVHFAVYAYFLKVGEPGSCSVLIGPPTPLATPSHSMDKLHVFSLVFSLSHYPIIKKKYIQFYYQLHVSL